MHTCVVQATGVNVSGVPTSAIILLVSPRNSQLRAEAIMGNKQLQTMKATYRHAYRKCMYSISTPGEGEPE